ncbi:MAG TPA: hypothetical protein VG389_04655 [Myxococcota bacterium]|jgi:hypothetical protein|nr:hypothetical protein [Myxococcota bacterium]
MSRARVAAGLALVALGAASMLAGAARLWARAGGVVDDGRMARYGPYAPPGPAEPHVVWNGAALGLVWAVHGGREDPVDAVRFARFEADGRSLGSPRAVVAGERRTKLAAPRLAWSSAGAGWAVAWLRDHPDGGTWWAAGLAPDGAARGEERPLSGSGAVDGRCARFAPGKDGTFAAAWRTGDGRHDGRFRRIDAAGEPVGGEAQLWSAFDAAGCGDLSWSGREWAYVVGTWHADGRAGEVIFGRLSSRGERLDDAAPLGVAGPSPEVSVAWDGRNWGVAWTEHEDGFVWFRLVPPDGPDAAHAAVLLGARARSPRIAATADGFAVAWSRSDGIDEAVLELALVGADGNVAAPARRVTDPAVASFDPSLAALPGGGLVLAFVERRASGDLVLRLLRLDAAGVPRGEPREVSGGGSGDPG